MTTVLTDRLREAFGLELTAAERLQLRELTGLVAGHRPGTGSGSVDEPGWQAYARAMSCRLPGRLLAAIRDFRHDPGADGTLTVGNLPIEPGELPPTPAAAGSVERDTTGPATLATLLGQQLGEIIAYRAEKQGALVQNVVPVAALATSQSNGGSVPLEFHTENAFHPHRPDYVGLLCLRPAHEDQVGTQVASIRRALPLLGPPSRATLHQARFVTAAPPSFGSGDSSEPRPVLTGSPDDPDLCVDFHATTALDGPAAEALTALRAALDAVRADLVLRPGMMVFVDNRVVVHGRVGFTPRYDGHDRWLHRVFVHLDHRRTRAWRAGNGAILV